MKKEMEVEVETDTSSPDFEFTTLLAGVTPADDLFYKGQLLPLALPPRLQMVQALSSAKEVEKRGVGERQGRKMPFLPVLEKKGKGKGAGFRSAAEGVGRNFWHDSASEKTSDSSADSSSDSRDSSGSSKDSVDLAGEKGEGNGGYGGGRGRGDRFFHNLAVFGRLGGGQGRIFSWLKPTSSRWIFGGKKGGGAGPQAKKAAVEEESVWEGDSNGPAFFARPGSPPRDSCSSEDLAPPRLRFSGPLTACDDEFLSCKERLSGPLTSRGTAVLRLPPSSAQQHCEWEELRSSLASQNLAEDKQEWRSGNWSFREGSGLEKEACKQESSFFDGSRRHRSGASSFHYREPVEPAEKLKVPRSRASGPLTSDGEAKRGSVGMETGGRHRYLDKLFRSFHVRSFAHHFPLKTGDVHKKIKPSQSSRRTSDCASASVAYSNPIFNTSTELHSSIRGAIEHCKKSQGKA